MNIGLLGTGMIGKTLARTLSAAGHNVKVANSRGPDTIPADILENGAQAVTVEEALTGVDTVILSIPPTSYGKIKHLMATLPEETVVIDTSNYYPQRDGRFAALDAGQVEAEWVSEQVGRSVVKAWNAIGSESFAHKGSAKGTPGRIAIPVAGDSEHGRNIAIALVEDSGFDGFDAGPLVDSWRQQPAAPAYCTDLTSEEMGPALAAAEKERLPARRDIAIAAISERTGDQTSAPTHEFLTRLNRALFLP